MTADAAPRQFGVFAPAKVNLTLHVTARRDDGYHLLDSLVVFASEGDRLSLAASQVGTLRISGPERAGVPAGHDNLIARVAALFAAPAAITLEKRLPMAAGLGGGSADAAAAFRGLMALGGEGAPDPQMYDPRRTRFRDALVRIGADIPVCLQCLPMRMGGIGDDLQSVTQLPVLYALLVNAGVPVATQSVFAALETRRNAPMPAELPRFAGPHELIWWLRDQRNDLQEAACRIAPSVGEVLRRLERDPDCLLARMSGSGGTCFGLFEGRSEVEAARDRLRRDCPDWWIRAARLGSMGRAALPKVS